MSTDNAQALTPRQEAQATSAAPPYCMLPSESARAFRAFEIYRDLGPDRSLEQLFRAGAAPIPTLKRWSAAHDWQARVRAFDKDAAALAAGRALDDAAAVRVRQAAHAKELQARAMQKIAAMDPQDMTVSEAVRAWAVGAEAERRALGISDVVEPAKADAQHITIEYVNDWRARRAGEG